jgi:signal transduction histidine kinase
LGSAIADQGVRAGVLSVVRDLNPVLGFAVQVSFDGPVDSTISNETTEHLLAVVREAVTNVGRHAHASKASVSVSVANGVCRLEVVDDGDGIDTTAANEAGFGLVNLRHRAEKLHGSFEIESLPNGGTSIVWQVPTS